MPTASVRTIALDFDLPDYNVSIWWHSKTQTDPLLRWVRSELTALATRMGVVGSG